MSNSLPAGAATTHPGPPALLVAADPAALDQLGAQLQQRAAALRTGAPALLSAWRQAAGALGAQHTGSVLASTWPGSGAVFERFAESVEALARALHGSAMSYASAEAAAVPGSAAS